MGLGAGKVSGRTRRLCVASVVLPQCLALLFLSGSLPAAELGEAALSRWAHELSNWARWGKNDQRGTVNLITADKIRNAAKLVREGYSVSLSRDANTVAAADNLQPFGQKMTATGAEHHPMFAMDTFTIGYHNQAQTHFDSLSHMFAEGKMYNGYPQALVNANGAGQLAVTAFKSGLVSRGILVDIPLLKGVSYLKLSTPIMPNDLEAWEKRAGLKISEGDIVLVRTGRWARRAAEGPWDIGKAAAGLHPSCARWMHGRGVAVFGSDTHGELMPSIVTGVPFPLHRLLLVAMGTPMFDNCDLESLSREADSRHRWEFLFVASPLAIPGGTGSPLNPLAIF